MNGFRDRMIVREGIYIAIITDKHTQILLVVVLLGWVHCWSDWDRSVGFGFGFGFNVRMASQ